MIERAAVRFNPDDYYEMAVDKDAVTCDVHGFMNGEPIDFSGGGGESNVISGTFKFSTTENRSFDLNIPYTGSGYPVGFVCWLKNGVAGTEVKNARQSALLVYSFFKVDIDTAPEYGGIPNTDWAYGTVIYKSSSPGTLSGAGSVRMNTLRYSQSEPTYDTFGINSIVIKNSNTISIGVATSDYGVLSDFDYDYVVVYSE